MPKRIAITISGAVSLGTYESGVLYELLTAMEQHNNDPATAASEKFIIDVMTGASAGGMTTAIAANKLLFEKESLIDQFNNSLYLAWVRDVSLTALLQLSGDDDSTKSILSSQLVETISQRYITHRYASGVPLGSSPHSTIGPNGIYLGLAMSNLNGIDYTRNLRTGGDFPYTRHQDELIRPLSSTCDNMSSWESIRQGAVACGAFPFFFRVQELIRQQIEFTDPKYNNRHPSAFPATANAYAYTDGGVFQNEPLGLAKNLVDRIDKHLETDSRYYIYIAPGPKESSLNKVFRASHATFLPTAMQLLESIFDQSRFQDWVDAEELNEQIDLFNARAIQLKDVLLDNTVTPGSLDSASTALLPLLFKKQAGGPGAAIASARTRLESQFKDDYDELERSAAGKGTSWIDAILVLETGAQLGEYDEMNIFGITADTKELAGAGLMAFAGFFDQALRDHDYALGRKNARVFIDEQNNSKSQYKLGPIRYKPTPATVPNYDPSLGDFSVDDLDQATRKRLLAQINDRAWEFMGELKLNDIVRFGIKELVIEPKLKHWLGL